jgi:small-conductance mechanosensitive channel
MKREGVIAKKYHVNRIETPSPQVEVNMPKEEEEEEE